MPKPDLDVEDILVDIRRRVLDENGMIEDDAEDAGVQRDRETDAAGVRINTYLMTTEGLRTSLPPVRSDRTGWIANIELWIKGRIERAMRWFVFDQVNFNSTVHQILSELRAVQVRQEKILSAYQARAELEADRREQDQRVLNEEQRAANEDQRRLNEEQRALDEELRQQMNESAVIIDRMRRNFEHRLTKLEEGGS